MPIMMSAMFMSVRNSGHEQHSHRRKEHKHLHEDLSLYKQRAGEDRQPSLR
jgi:hypothetical protein